MDAGVKEAIDMKGKLLIGNEAGLHLLGTNHPLLLLAFRGTVRKWCERVVEFTSGSVAHVHRRRACLVAPLEGRTLKPVSRTTTHGEIAGKGNRGRRAIVPADSMSAGGA